jgi:hypothetical protein
MLRGFFARLVEDRGLFDCVAVVFTRLGHVLGALVVGFARLGDALVERGLAKRHMGNSGAVYTVTAAGMAAAGATYYVPREMRNAAK